MRHRPPSPAEIVDLCVRSVDSVALRQQVMRRLQQAISYEGAFFATTDPATLLYTSAVRVNMPADASPSFLRTEFGVDDVNQVRDLARAATPVGWLDAVTHGDRESSLRYREAMRPIGLGDELRVALRVDGACWGLLCLHRGAGVAGFEPRDARLLAALAPHLAEGLRTAVLFDLGRAGLAGDGPGVAVVSADFGVRSRTVAAQRWWDELADLDTPRQEEMPTVVRGVIEALRIDPPLAPRPHGARVRTRSGLWLELHASYLDNADHDVAVVIEPATPARLGPLVVAAYRLTAREAEVARQIVVGLARKQIANELRISLHTVNDHVKAIYDKVGVASAGELRLRLFGEGSEHS